MVETVWFGLGSLGVLFVLIALRLPVAYAMIVVGGGGIALINGTAPVLNQLKTLAYGQFSTYDLSAVPMFVLMGVLASQAGLSAALFRGSNGVAWMVKGRGGYGGHRGLRRF